MRNPHQHAWDVSTKEAKVIQQRLRDAIITEDQLDTVDRVAGVDVSFNKQNNLARAAAAVLSYPELQPLEKTFAELPIRFPYIPGLLSFREAPAALKALTKLKVPPHLILCDGHGLAHPRRFGLACHIGLLMEIPSIGVAKRRLVGRHKPVPSDRGSWEPIRYEDQIIGAALRTRPGTNPIYVSIGHRVSLKTAIIYVLGCTTKYRIPETTRHAHRLASFKS
jgi:deoxyribonuclease V